MDNQYSRNPGKALLSLVIAAFLIWPALSASPSQPKRTRVRVGYYLEPGLCEQLPDKTFSGAILDYLVPLAQLGNWEIVPVLCTYAEAIDQLANSQIDLVGGVLDSPELRKKVHFLSVATGAYSPHLFTHVSSRRAPGRFKTWDGIEIALGPGEQSHAMLNLFLTGKGVTNRTLRVYENASEAMTAFRFGQVESVFTLGVKELLSARILESFSTRPLYFCVAPARTDLLTELEKNIRVLNSLQPNLGRHVRDNRFPVCPRNEVILSAEERDFVARHIAAHKPIVVDLSPASPPFKDWDEKTNQPIGLVPDILNEVGHMTGLEFQFLKPGKPDDARSRYFRRQIDFWAPFGTESEDMSESANALCLATLPHILLTRRGNMPTDLSQASLAVPMWDKEWQNDYRSSGFSKLVPVTNLTDALFRIADGQIDAVSASLPQAILVCQKANLFNKIDFSSLKMRLPHHQRVMLIPAAGVDPLLISILSKYLTAIPERDMTMLAYHAVSESMPTMILSDEQWLALMLALSGLAILIMFAIFVFFHIRLSRALTRAQAGERARTRFLATMSHEIRTPLNAVIGFAEFLTQPNLSVTSIRNYALGIFRASHVLLDLINDVLDLSKLEAGHINLRDGTTDLLLLKHEFLTIFASKIRARGNRFNFNLDTNSPRVKLSQLHVRQILLNLIGNAVKFTANGTVTCTIRFHTTAEGVGDLEILVSDTGIGITPSRLQSIFNPFEQDIAQRGGHIYEGTGLGLPIVKSLSEAAGGSVKVTSAPGKGSTFVVHIPNVEAATEARAESAPHAPRTATDPKRRAIEPGMMPKSVLLVDDIPLNLLILKEHLQRLGVKNIRTATSGAAALRLLEAEPVEMILTDVWMPEMNGPTLARKVRENPANAKTRIIAVTADVEASHAFDMTAVDAVLTKPVTREKLFAACSRR